MRTLLRFLRVFLALANCLLAAPAPRVAPKTAAAVRPISPPMISQPHSGDQIVHGSAEPNVSAVRIKIYSADGLLVQQNDALVDPSDLRFFGGLRRPLEANQLTQ